MIELVSSNQNLIEMMKGRISTSGLSAYRILWFSYGAIGENLKPDTCYVVNRIAAGEGGRDCYPDMLYNLPYEEAMISEVNVPASEDVSVIFEADATELFRSLSRKCSYDRILICRHTTTELTEKVIEDFEKTIRFLEQLPEDKQTDSIVTDVKQLQERLAHDMMLSVTMQHELEQLLHYGMLDDKEDMSNEIDKLYTEGLLPCKDKKEGRAVLDEIRKRIL